MPKFSDYFNSTTIRGRANVAKATLASIAVLYLYERFSRKKRNKVAEAPKVETNSDTHSQKPHYNVNQEDYKYHSCESNLLEKHLTKQQDLHEADPTMDCCKFDCNCEQNPAAAAESTNSKSHYGSKELRKENGDYYSDSPIPVKGSCP